MPVDIQFTSIAEGLLRPEGPVALSDGSSLPTEVAHGTVCRVSASGAVSVVAELGGGPNGAAVGPDGAVYVCNNGGFDWAEAGGLALPHGIAPDYKTGSIQRVDLATGAVTTVYDACDGRALRGPNDIVFDR